VGFGLVAAATWVGFLGHGAFQTAKWAILEMIEVAF
jgi:hypothetical protein